MSLFSKAVRVASELPKGSEPRRDLLKVLKESRVVPEKLRAKYQNIGDFGGTPRILASWHLEVAGPTFDIKDDLKKLGLRWEKRRKMWGLWATEYSHPGFSNKDARRQGYRNYGAIRDAQKKAWPQVQRLVKDYNDKIDKQIDQKRDLAKDPKDALKKLLRSMRMGKRLEEYGVEISYDWPSRYSVDEAKVRVSGNTYELRGLMKQTGWRWKSGSKAWELSVDEYNAISADWMAKTIRALKGR
jgi:hypothetical protein